MTKKDYILIAHVFKTTADIWLDARTQWQVKRNNAIKPKEIDDKINSINKILANMSVIVEGLSLELERDNPLFNSEKFKKACEVSNDK